MVTRSRRRFLLFTVAFYAFSAGAVGYFAWHAQHGDRGLKAKSAYKIRIAEVTREIEAVKAERAEWEHRVALLRVDNLDRDLLDEQARRLLNLSHKNDVVIIFDRK
jgi:cell division protein FtsB